MMSDNSFFAAFFFPALAAAIIFSMKYLAAIVQARTRLSQDEAYRDIATQTVATQAAMAEKLSSMNASLTEIQSKLTALEKILKDVE